MFNFRKKQKETQSEEKPNVKPKSINKDFFKQFQKEKKELLPKGTLTREEVLREIEKQIQKQSGRSDNPFKTRDDVYYCFYDSNMRLVRANVPFEEVKIGGKSFYINKRFEGGKIIVEEMYSKPVIEINLKEEYSKKQTTKKQLEKINKYILNIKNKIAKGEEQYSLLDIEDLREEKFRLEKILDSIKYGKVAYFEFENPYNNKKTYFLRYNNGEYKYLKVTENNFLTEENNIKFLKGYEIQKRLEEITNLRIVQNWKQIAIAILTVLAIIGIMVILFKGITFEEELFDKRVKDYCGEQSEAYRLELENIREWKCSLTTANAQNTPTYNQVR